LTYEQIKFVEKAYINYCNLGLNLPDDKYNRVKEINKQMGVYASTYRSNISNVNTKFTFTKEELQGMDEQWLNQRFNSETLTYTVSLQYPDYIPIMDYCEVSETRKKMSLAFGSRCIDSNLPIMLDTIKLRKERAELFGFESATDYKLQENMAKDSHTVNAFLSNLMEKINPLVESDLIKLLELAGSAQLNPWDLTYYSRIYTEQFTQLDQRELAKLFSMESVQKGIFSIYQELLGLVFTDVTQENPNALYSSDVKLFQVSDETNQTNPIGYFYLDMFPRDGKYSHAAMFTLIRKSKYNLPVSAIVCNFDPLADVEFDNVVTFFHEFGHLMHNMVSTNEISGLAGTACQRDFVETPSQMFEQWCYCKEPLMRLVKPEAQVKVTDELVNKINIAAKTMQGIHNGKQVLYGLLDAAIHSSSPPEDTWEYYSSNYSKLFKMQVDRSVNMLANWGHMFGYDSQYYGYQWALVYAHDLFSFFKADCMNKELGRKLRDKVLAVGGAKSGLEVLRDFMDREPDANAFVNWLIC
jgi:thimet oligopeptidase